MNNTKFKQTEIGLIPEKWDINKLGDLITHKKGFAFKSDWYKSEGHNIIKVSDFTDSSVVIDNCVCIDSDLAKNYLEYKLYKDDIVIATVGSWPNNPDSIVGRVIKIPIFAEGSLLNQNAVIIRCKDKDSQLFLFYRLKLKDFSEYLISGAQGSANQAAITLNDIFSFEIGCPPLPEQKAIAKILSDLDSKIELNQQMNKTLEEIGKTLFKRWFVDFEFPNEEGNPYKLSGGEMEYNEELKKEIPNGWKVGYLGDNKLTSFVKVGINEFDGEKIYVATADINNSDVVNYNTKITFGERPSRANMQPLENTVWFAKMKDSKKITYFDKFSDWEIANIILSTGFAGFTVKENALYYIWNIISNEEFEVIKDNLCNGTTMQAINNENIKNIKILIPSADVLNRYNFIISNVFIKISENKRQNRKLVETRDLLLPKLMSGKIRVKI